MPDDDNVNDDDVPKLRVDKWLWMARFFKTRQLATKAVTAGKIRVNTQRVKPAFKVKPGDGLVITRREQMWIVEVLDIPKRRGPAKEAQLLYEESEESIAGRKVVSDIRRAERMSRPREEVRPDKRQRRLLRALKQKD